MGPERKKKRIGHREEMVMNFYIFLKAVYKASQTQNPDAL